MRTEAKWSRRDWAWIPEGGIRGRICEGFGKGGRVVCVESESAGAALLFISCSEPLMAPVGKNGVAGDDCGPGDDSENSRDGG